MTRLKLVTPIEAEPKSYKTWLKAKDAKSFKIERTPKRAGEYEFDHNGRLVPCVKN